MGTYPPRLPCIPALGAARRPTPRSTAGGLRRGGDSNPRYPFEVQRLSRAPDSATLAPLQFSPPRGGRRRLASEIPSTLLVRVKPGAGELERRGRDSNPRNRGAAQRFSRPPPSTTRTPLPSTKNAPAAESSWLKAAAHFFALLASFTIPIDRSFVNKTALFGAILLMDRAAMIRRRTRGCPERQFYFRICRILSRSSAEK